MLTLGFLSILELTPIFDVIEQPVAMDAAPVEPKVLRLLIMASRTRRFATEPLRLRCCCCGGRGGFAPPPHTAVTLAAVNAAAAVVAPILGIARHDSRGTAAGVPVASPLQVQRLWVRHHPSALQGQRLWVRL